MVMTSGSEEDEDGNTYPSSTGTCKKLRLTTEATPTPPRTARNYSDCVISSFFHRMQQMKKIIDGHEVGVEDSEASTDDDEDDNPNEITEEELAKLMSLRAWDARYQLEPNWWFIKLHFKAERRHIIEDFHTNINSGTISRTGPTQEPLAGFWSINEQNLPAKVATFEANLAAVTTTTSQVFLFPSRLYTTLVMQFHIILP
jgi:hypothetical protein